jgi:uncharacterized protein (TIGR02246 family)
MLDHGLTSGKGSMKATCATVAVPLVIAAFLTLRGGVVAQPPEGDRPPAGANALAKEDDAAVREVIAAYEAAWNTHDMRALGKLFREDAECINIVGMHWRGRDAIEKAHAAYHATMFKDHRIKTDAVEVRALGGGHAVAVVTTTNDAFTTPGGQVMPKAQNRQTYVLTKAADGWKVAHFHNVVVNAEAVKHDPVNAPKK